MISKTLLVFSIGLLILCFIFLLISNPKYNYPLSELIELQTDKALAEKIKKQQDWVYDQYSDIGNSSENYPIVVLRHGFKIIREEGDKVLVGWRYEVINTSPENNYTASIDFKLIDYDGFEVGSVKDSVYVKANSYAELKNTFYINRIELDRVKDST